ncbi:MAG: hypothetical protein ABFS32_06895 [Bacteroidota bacterium]
MKRHLFSILTIFAIISCNPMVDDSEVPHVIVNVEINLNDIDNVDLSQIGGYIYVEGGVRGIILRRESQDIYRAFDRNCTFQPADECAVVDMHTSGFYMEDTCCNSTFDLSGFPTGGPAEYPLREYGVAVAGDILYIYNN